MNFSRASIKLLLAALCLFAASVAAGQSAVPRTELRLNEPLEGRIVDGQTHEYTVTLKANDFTQLRLEQRGVEVALSVSSDGDVASSLSQQGKEGSRLLSFIAFSGGTYIVKVERLKLPGNAPSGDYSITLTARRAAAGKGLGDGETGERSKTGEGFPDLTVPTGHPFGLESVAFSPDGRVLASGSTGMLKLWDVATGKELRTLKGAAHDGDSMAFSPDGKILVAAGAGAEVKFWNVATGDELRVLGGHAGVVASFAFSPDGKKLLTGSYDQTIRLWDVAAWKELHAFKGAPCCAFVVAFSPDGKVIAGGGEKNSVKLWDAATGRELKSIEGAFSSVNALAFSPDGKTLAGKGISRPSSNLEVPYGLIKLWDVQTGSELRTINASWSFKSQIAFSPDGKILADAASKKLWDVQTGKALILLQAGNSTVTTVTFSRDGKTLAGAGGFDHTVKLWDPATGREVKSLRGYSQSVYAVAYSPDGGLLAVGGADGIVKLWDMVTGELRSFKGRTSFISSVAFSPDGKILATSEYGKLLPSGEIGDIIQLWDVQTGGRLKTLKGPSGSRDTIAFSPDGRTLAVAGYVEVMLWDVATGNMLQRVEEIPCCVYSVAFSPDGKTLAGGGINNGTMRLWDVRTGKELVAFDGKTVAVKSVAFSPDGKVLASGDIHSVIKLWDVRTGAELETLRVAPDGFNDLAFQPDTKTLLLRNRAGPTMLWDTVAGRRRTFRDLPQPAGKFSEDIFVLQSGRVVKADTEGNTIVLRDAASDDDIVTLIVLGENDWAVIDPVGRWDASDGAQKLMYYSLATPDGYEIIDFSQLKERYYEPDLLPKLLGHSKEALKDVARFKDVLLPPAVVSIAPRDAASTLRRVRLRNRNGGIGRVQVFVNGREFIEDARDAKLRANPNLKEYELSFDLKGAPFIPGETPDVRVVAWNYDERAKERYKGYISSRGTEIVYRPAEAQAEPPTLYAIVGGVSDYKGDALDLRFAAKDAEHFYRAIEVGGRNLFGAERLKLKLLSTGDDKSAITPTKENFRRAFTEFAREAKPNDILIVYLAGHGITLDTGGNAYYYLTAQAATADKEVLGRDGELLSTSTISSEELTRWHKSIQALKQVLILDTCAAGALGDGFRMADKRKLSSDAKRVIDDMRTRVGFHVLMGSAADAVSYEASQYGQGLLTYSLLQGMKGAALQPDGQVDVSRLFNYAANTVPVLAKNVGGIQRPEIRVPLGGTSFALGLIKTEGDKRQIPLSTVRPIVLRPNFQNQEGIGDDLGIASLLRDRLREASYAAGGEGEAGLVFIDADEMPDAINPYGRYVVEGDVVRVTVRLYRNRVNVATISVLGNKANLLGLSEKLLEVLLAESQKFVPGSK